MTYKTCYIKNKLTNEISYGIIDTLLIGAEGYDYIEATEEEVGNYLRNDKTIYNDKIQQLSSQYYAKRNNVVLVMNKEKIYTGYAIESIRGILQNIILCNQFPATLYVNKEIIIKDLKTANLYLNYINSQEVALILNSYWVNNYNKHAMEILNLFNDNRLLELQEYNITITNDLTINVPNV